MKILAVGVARSGTSFLGELFRQNPELVYLYEPFWGDTFFARRQWTWLTEADRDPEAERLLRETFDGRFDELERQQPTPQHAKGGFASRREELEAQVTAQQNGAALPFAIKEIRLNMHLRWAAAVLGPELRIVHLVRDPRGVAASFLFSDDKPASGLRRLLGAAGGRRAAEPSEDSLYREWGGWFREGIQPRLGPDYREYGRLFDSDRPHERVAARWVVFTGQALTDAATLPAAQYLRVRYEDLCRDPLGVAGDIYRFLGRLLPATVEQWLVSNTQGGDRGDRYGTSRNSREMVDVWKTQLDRRQISDIEAVCRPVMAQLGYEPF
jgi:hypothetical protein